MRRRCRRVPRKQGAFPTRPSPGGLGWGLGWPGVGERQKGSANQGLFFLQMVSVLVREGHSISDMVRGLRLRPGSEGGWGSRRPTGSPFLPSRSPVQALGLWLPEGLLRGCGTHMGGQTLVLWSQLRLCPSLAKGFRRCLLSQMTSASGLQPPSSLSSLRCAPGSILPPLFSSKSFSFPVPKTSHQKPRGLSLKLLCRTLVFQRMVGIRRVEEVPWPVNLGDAACLLAWSFRDVLRALIRPGRKTLAVCERRGQQAPYCPNAAAWPELRMVFKFLKSWGRKKPKDEHFCGTGTIEHEPRCR